MEAKEPGMGRLPPAERDAAVRRLLPAIHAAAAAAAKLDPAWTRRAEDAWRAVRSLAVELGTGITHVVYRGDELFSRVYYSMATCGGSGGGAALWRLHRPDAGTLRYQGGTHVAGGSRRGDRAGLVSVFDYKTD